MTFIGWVTIVVPIAALLATVYFSFRQIRNSELSKQQRKEEAREDAVQKLETVPWLFMADGIREQEPSGDWEQKIREQRREKLREILDWSYQGV